MEHILQFAVNIDDDAIVKNIIKNAEKNITKELEKQVRSCLFKTGTDYYGRDYNAGMTTWMENYVKEFFITNKDEIIYAAANKLANKMIKTKAVKEAIGDVINEVAE